MKRDGAIARRMQVMNAIDFTLMAQAGTEPRSYRNGDTIFREGDAADCLYVIQQGDVEIRLGNRVLGTLNHGSMFGEMALIDGAPRSATAVAASDVTLVPINEKQFLFMVSHTPYIALNVMRVLADRLRHMNQTL
jgi:CRP-like cAMP-binding protein